MFKSGNMHLSIDIQWNKMYYPYVELKLEMIIVKDESNFSCMQSRMFEWWYMFKSWNMHLSIDIQWNKMYYPYVEFKLETTIVEEK